jgi:hypothetical protein
MNCTALLLKNTVQIRGCVAFKKHTFIVPVCHHPHEIIFIIHRKGSAFGENFW